MYPRAVLAPRRHGRAGGATLSADAETRGTHFTGPLAAARGRLYLAEGVDGEASP